MALLIDGYNLLHVLPLGSRGLAPGMLERWRTRLLNLIAASLGPEQARQVTVVFDAPSKPLLAPDPVSQHEGITVRFAVGYEDADELLEELIRQHPTPKKLTVVSSDRRIQRAARRRRAQAVGSEQWYEQLLRSRQTPPDSDAEPAEPTDRPLDEDEVKQWLAEFGLEDEKD